MVNRTIIQKKDRGTAIILAIFFGVFAWIYTWKFDKSKFWGGLIAGVFLGWTIIVPIGLWLWVLIDMCTKPKDQFTNYHKYKIK